MPILFSRGCHWASCAFCEESTATTKYRARTPDNVVDEMEQRIRNDGVKYFLFCDQTITATSIERLADAILARGLDVRYGFSGFYASRHVTRDVLHKAHASGCRWLYIGVESLTQRLIDLMAKGTEVAHVLDVIRWCREIGILPFASYFFGFPTQTADEVKQEARIARDSASFFTIPGDGGEFFLTTGSAIYRHPEKYSVDHIETHASFATPTGTITSISPRYRAPGLSGAQARRLFLDTVGDDYPYEAGAFWSHYVILGDNRVDLVFPRAYYRARLARPARQFADHMRNGGVPIDDGPQAAKLNYQLGAFHAADGDHARALPPLRRAAELAPVSVEAQRALAVSALDAGDDREALRAAERAIALGDDDVALHALAASCHERLGDPVAALDIYRQLARRFPSKLALVRQIGRLSKRIGEQTEAEGAGPR
ncbi:MAG: radical SAM protein [Deltaproteobacteria bacterium]|nr:MAG: radical SAM protein [Deltaproteobacteria bacterium]